MEKNYSSYAESLKLRKAPTCMVKKNQRFSVVIHAFAYLVPACIACLQTSLTHMILNHQH